MNIINPIVYTFNEIKNNPTLQKVTLIPGKWLLECQGAYGGYKYNTRNSVNDITLSNGGYSKGELLLHKTTTLYVSVGIKEGQNFNNFGGAGKGSAETTGNVWDYKYAGGSSDIRLLGGAWDNEQGLLSRIIVAGGAGYGENAGGGGIEGLVNTVDTNLYTKATQTSPGLCKLGGIDYTNLLSGVFGKGGFRALIEADNKLYTPGGGGWYGGTGSVNLDSGGGSGYVLTSSSIKPNAYIPTSEYWLENASTTTGQTVWYQGKIEPYVKITLLESIPPKLSTTTNLGEITNNNVSYTFKLETTTEAQVSVVEKLNNEVINTRKLSSGDYTTTIDKSKISTLALNSQNTITVTATDSTGKEIIQTITFIKVNTKPKINIISYNSISATFTAVDIDNNLSKIEWYLDDVLKETITTDLTAEKTINYELTDNAIHTLKIVATDAENATVEKVLSISKEIMPLQTDASLSDISTKLTEIGESFKSGKTSIINTLALKNIDASLNNTLVELSEKIKISFDSSDASVQELQNRITDLTNQLSQRKRWAKGTASLTISYANNSIQQQIETNLPFRPSVILVETNLFFTNSGFGNYDCNLYSANNLTETYAVNANKNTGPGRAGVYAQIGTISEKSFFLNFTTSLYFNVSQKSPIRWYAFE
ncbi:TPA: glycine-rich protein [Clostridioides difficile]